MRLAALVLATSLFLAGCGALPGGGGDCGPGENELASLAEVTTAEGVVATMTVRGSVERVNETAFAVSDGTGRAIVVTGSTNEVVGTSTPPDRVSEGDCVTVQGLASPLPGNDEYDGSLLAEAEDITVE